MNASVYWALSELYADDVRRIEETVRVLAAKHAPPPIPNREIVEEAVADAPGNVYDRGGESNVSYQLSSYSRRGPRVQTIVAPYYPDDLLEQKVRGEVVMDVQVTPEGDVGGLWLVSSVPDVFATLATNAVRQWKFEPIPTKIRVVLDFKP